MLKIDAKDEQLLKLLDENARFSNSQLARKIGLSKPAIEYRLQRFAKNNIIFSYYTIINFTALGYSHYKIYFKFQNATLENEKEIIEYWSKDNSTIWVGSIRGRWDLAVSILAKNNYEFGHCLSDFMNKFSEFVLEKDVLLTEYSPLYLGSPEKEFVYGIPFEIKTLDDIDKKILKILSGNSRINIVDLAQQTKLTRDIITYRIKKLVQNNIIISYRCYPNFETIGIDLFKVIIRTKNLNNANELKLKTYVAQHEKITQMIKLIGSWDLEFEIETKDEDELYQILNQIRTEFSNILRDFDVIRISKTHKYNYYPFEV